MRAARRAIIRYMIDGLGEPRGTADRLADMAIRHGRQFSRDADRLQRGGSVTSAWQEIEVRGPMFYGSYAEVAEPDQALVIVMPHLGCYASALFHLHQFSPLDRPVCAWRHPVARSGHTGVFAGLENVGPPVGLLEGDDGGAVRALSALRHGGVLVSFVDVIGGRADPVELFGKPAVLSDAAVRVGRLARAALVFVHVTGVHRRLYINISEPRNLAGSTTAETMIWIAEQLEGAIREAPEQWLHWLLLGEMWKQGTYQRDVTPASLS